MNTVLDFNFLRCLISSTTRPKWIVGSRELAEAVPQKGETMIRIKEVLLRPNYESDQEQRTKEDGRSAPKMREECLVSLNLLVKILL